MDVAEITNLIMAIVPSLTAVVTTISAIIVCIINIKKLMNKHIIDATTENTELRNCIKSLMVENAELKRELVKTNRRLNHIVEANENESK